MNKLYKYLIDELNIAGGFNLILFGRKQHPESGTAMLVNCAATICKEGKILYRDNCTEINMFMTSTFCHDSKNEWMKLWLLLTKYNKFF